jgi:murein DD-endopeptidase MepM/ murein hydrolase activator NlpD
MKYIGSDFQVQPINTQMQDAKLLDVPNLANDSFNSIRQSVAESQRINSTAANADAEAVGRKVVVQQPASGGIIGGITEIAKVGLGYLEAQKKAEAAAAEKEFILEANKLAANAPDLINKTDQGGIGYQAKVEELARKNPNISQEVLNRELVKLYAPIQKYQEVGVEKLNKEGARVKESQTENFVLVQSLNLHTQLADLELIPDPNERQIKIDNVVKVFTDSLVSSKLTNSEKLFATNAFLTVLGKSSTKGSEVGARLMSTLREINDTNAFIEQNRNMPPEQLASLNMARLAILSPSVRAAYEPVLDLAKVHQREVDAYKQNQELNNAVKQNRLDAKRAFKLQSGMADSLLVRYLNADGNQRAMMDAEYADVPAIKAVTTDAAKSYFADRDKAIALAKESGDIASMIANVGKGDAKERLGWVQQAYTLPNISLNTSVVAELQQAVQAIQRGLNSGVPAEVQKAQQDVEKYNGVVLQALKERARQVDTLRKDATSPWVRVDELRNDPQKRQIIEKDYMDTIRNLNAEVDASNKSILQGTNQNFNMPQLAELQVGDVKLPLPFKAGTNVTFTSDRTPNRNGRPHAGIDIAVAENTPLIAPIGGIIASAMSDAAYGNFIDVRTPDGKILRYAHLNSMNVKEGQQILPGQVLGLTGNTGRSSGAHLHFEVRNDLYGGYEKTEDPIAWSVKNLNNANRGLAARRGRNTPNGIPPNAVPLSGAYIQNNQIVRDDGTVGIPSYTARNPIKNMPLPADKNAYSSSPDKNYGYQALAQDKPFRLELNRVAKNLKIPTQWLADLMAFETGGTFSTSIENTGNYGGARGLIQFMPETAADLGTSSEALARMSRTQQMKYVEKYLMQHTDNGKLISKPEDLVMAVWGGIGNLQKLKRDPESVRNLSDGDIKFHQYVKRLGEHAGRFYETSYEPKVTPVHTKYRGSCTMCQALIRSGSGLLPHQAPP